MFEITPKEQILKNIRKGLVQPLPNNYANLNLDSPDLEKSIIDNDETFVKTWVDNQFLFHVYNGKFDLINQVQAYLKTIDQTTFAVFDTQLITVLDDIGLEYLAVEKMKDVLLSGFSKLETHSNAIYFNSETHPLTHFSKTKHLILFGGSSQIETIETNTAFTELSIKNNIKTSFDKAFFKQFESVLLLIDENQ